MRSIEKCCEDEKYISCMDVDLNFDDFHTMKKTITVAGITLDFFTEVPPMGFAYKNDNGTEAVFTYDKENHHLFGNINTDEGKSYEIESCQFGHIFREIDSNAHIHEFDGLLNLDDVVDYIHGHREIDEEELVYPHIRNDDKTTIVNVSIMFYYTKAFEDVTPDIEGEVNQALANTNMGFINSMIPVRVQKFCIERATGDVYFGNKTDGILTEFRMMKGTPLQTLSSADVAVLLRTGGGGQGWKGKFSKKKNSGNFH